MKKRYSMLAASFIVMAFLLFMGTWFFHVSEGWSYVDAMYFCVMTATTVGHGDIYLTHDVSKIVASAYALISIPIVLFVFGIIAENYFENRMRGLEKRLTEITSREEIIEEEIEETEEKINHKS